MDNFESVPIGSVVDMGAVTCRGCGSNQYVRFDGGLECSVCRVGCVLTPAEAARLGLTPAAFTPLPLPT